MAKWTGSQESPSAVPEAELSGVSFRSRSRSFSSSPSPSPTPSPHKPLAKAKGELLPPAGKG